MRLFPRIFELGRLLVRDLVDRISRLCISTVF